MMSTDRGLLPQQKENARHGESGFPIQRYRTTLHATYQDVPTHWHEEAEMTLIVRGGSTYNFTTYTFSLTLTAPVLDRVG